MPMWLRQLPQDIRFGVRSFLRTPGFTTLAVLSLALGIMATTAMYSVIHAVVLDPFPYKDVDALMSVKRLEPGQQRIPHLLHHRRVPRDRRAQHDFRRRRSRRRSPTCSGPDEGDPQRLRGNYGTPNTFLVMGVPALLGRPYLPDDAPDRRGAGRRARLPVLAAAVRRRPQRRRASTPPQRQGPHRRRGDAETVHVARRRRLSADHVRARAPSSRGQERASARAAEARRERRAGRSRSQCRSSRDIVGKVPTQLPADVACRRCCRSRRHSRAASAMICGCSSAPSACCC